MINFFHFIRPLWCAYILFTRKLFKKNFSITVIDMPEFVLKKKIWTRLFSNFTWLTSLYYIYLGGWVMYRGRVGWAFFLIRGGSTHSQVKSDPGSTCSRAKIEKDWGGLEHLQFWLDWFWSNWFLTDVSLGRPCRECPTPAPHYYYKNFGVPKILY